MKNCNNHTTPDQLLTTLNDKILTTWTENQNLNNDLIKEIINNEKMTTLDQELEKIDNVFDNELETFNLMEENNLEVLKSLNLDHSLSINNLKNKFVKVLDNKIILDAIIKLEKYEDNNCNLINNEKDKITKLIQSKIFYLSDQKITKLANLEIYENLEELYLQRNFIKEIENLKYLKNLQILNLNNNYLRKIENLEHLDNLKVLDLADNLIEEFHVEKLPKFLMYLYLFDNLFYDNFKLLKYRSICIRHMSRLIRLDYLNISDQERLMLMDDKNLKNKMRFFIIQNKLKNVKLHYEEMRSERKSLLKEFENNSKNKDIKKNNILINEEDIFITINKQNLDISNIKKRSEYRIKQFEESSNLRMKDLKVKLEDIRSKFKNLPLLYDDRKDKIKERIDKAIKFEEKMKNAEEIEKKINDRENDIEGNNSMNRGFVIIQNNNNITENNNIRETQNENENIQNRTHNSLLSDLSDLSFIKKNNN